MATGIKAKKTNQLKALIALTKASLLSTFRNPAFLFFNFLFPFVFIVIFGSLNNENITFDVGVKNDSITDGILYESFEKIDSLNFVLDKSDEELEAMLRIGRISVVIDIQEDQSLILPNMDTVSIYRLDIEESVASPQSAQIIKTLLNHVVNNINKPPEGIYQELVSVSNKVVEGRKFQTVDFILPGQLAFALLTNALFGISYTFISLKK